MFFTRHKTNLLEPEQVLPGRETPLPVPGAPRRPRHPAAAAVPRGPRDRRVRPRLLLGRRARLLEGARRLHDGRRLRGRPDAEPDLRGGVLRAHRPHRGRARRLRPRRDLLRGAAEALLGEPRPDPGHAPGQRRRHPVPLGDLHDHAGAARGREGVGETFQKQLGESGYGEITTEIAEAGPFYYAEDYHQQYLAKNPNGYCGLGGTGVSCPIGTGVTGALSGGTSATCGGALHELGEAALARRLPLGARDPVHGRAPVGARPGREVRARGRVGREHRRVGLRQRVARGRPRRSRSRSRSSRAALEGRAAGGRHPARGLERPRPWRCSRCSRCCAACAA